VVWNLSEPFDTEDYRFVTCSLMLNMPNTWPIMVSLVQPLKFWYAVVCCRSHWALNSGAKGLRKCLPHLIISALNILMHLHFHHGGLSYSFIHVHSLISVFCISPHTVFSTLSSIDSAFYFLVLLI